MISTITTYIIFLLLEIVFCWQKIHEMLSLFNLFFVSHIRYSRLWDRVIYNLEINNLKNYTKKFYIRLYIKFTPYSPISTTGQYNYVTMKFQRWIFPNNFLGSSFESLFLGFLKEDLFNFLQIIFGNIIASNIYL